MNEDLVIQLCVQTTPYSITVSVHSFNLAARRPVSCPLNPAYRFTSSNLQIHAHLILIMTGGIFKQLRIALLTSYRLHLQTRTEQQPNPGVIFIPIYDYRRAPLIRKLGTVLSIYSIYSPNLLNQIPMEYHFASIPYMTTEQVIDALLTRLDPPTDPQPGTCH